MIGCVVLLLVLPALILVYTAVDAVGVYLLWGWFAVPLLHLPALTFWQTTAVVLLIHAVHEPPPQPKETANSDAWVELVKPIVRTLYLVIVGYLLHRYAL